MRMSNTTELRGAPWKLIGKVSELAAIGAPLFSLADLRSRCAENGTSAAVSDAIAERYMDEHGSISFYEVQNGLRQRPSCPRLTSYWRFARMPVRQDHPHLF